MTTSKTLDSSNKSITSLIKTESIKDPDQYIKKCHAEIEKWKKYWKNKQEEYFEQNVDTNSPSVIEVNEIRRFFNQHLQNKLTQIEEYDPELKRQALRFIIPFNADNGITDFVLHFFQLEMQEGKPEYVERDPFEKEVHILYDIFKIKKTMECIDVMRKTLGNPEKEFKSQFSQQQKKEILEQLREVLKVLFRSTIKPELQKSIFQSINMEMINGESILERREKNFFYCYPHVIEKYDYRNLFFLIYFKEGLSAKVGGEQKTFHYNYMNFEILKQEYLTQWLESKLKDNPAKQKIYETFEIDNRTIASWIKEDPSKEIPLLKQLPINKFNNLIAQVDENVDDDLKAGMPSMSENHGEVAEFKADTKEATKLAKSPLKKLKSFLSFKKKSKESLEQLQSPGAVQEPELSGKKEPEWRIVALTAKQIPYFYLCQSASKYKSKLAMVRTTLGEDFQNLNKLVPKLMKAFGENRVVLRRTPKHDWVVPYSMKYVVGDQSTDYLFILGGEAKLKPKGMGYSTGDEYTYTPYVVFATATQNEQYGSVEGERQVGKKIYYEYNIANPETRKKVVEFMQMIKDKEFPST